MALLVSRRLPWGAASSVKAPEVVPVMATHQEETREREACIVPIRCRCSIAIAALAVRISMRREICGIQAEVVAPRPLSLPSLLYRVCIRIRLRVYRGVRVEVPLWV